MPLELSKVEDSDIEEYVRVELAGFHGDPVALIFHGCDVDSPPADIAALVAKVRKSLHEKKDFHKIKVCDTDTGEIVAVAQWNFQRAKTPEELEKLDIPNDAPPALAAILRTYLGTGNQIMGAKPYWKLGNMVTHPDHRRCGAASLLMRWGIEQMDRDGLEAYIDASPDGKLLYEHFGFKPAKEVVYEFSDSDIEVRETHTCMVRMPRSLTTEMEE